MTLIKAVEGFHVSYLFRKLGGAFYDERSSLSIELSMCTVLSVKLNRFWCEIDAMKTQYVDFF